MHESFISVWIVVRPLREAAGDFVPLEDVILERRPDGLRAPADIPARRRRVAPIVTGSAVVFAVLFVHLHGVSAQPFDCGRKLVADATPVPNSRTLEQYVQNGCH